MQPPAIPPLPPVEQSLSLAIDPALDTELGPPGEEPGEALALEEEEEALEPELELGLDLRADFEEPEGLEPEELEPEPEVVDEAPEERVFAPDGRSLRARRSIVVRAEPRQDAAPIGTLAQDMRVRWKQAVQGPGCAAWVEIEPRGWICERYLESNFREPRTRDLPLLAPGELTPGTYARVVGRGARAYPSLTHARWRLRGRRLKGAVTVRLVHEVRAGRRRFGRTSEGEYIDVRFLRVYTPSDFVGLDRQALEQLPWPLAWAQSRARPREPVQVRTEPAAEAALETVLPPRTVVALHELSADGRWARIAPAHWVATTDLHRAHPVAPPADLSPEERWLDLDLAEQVLVAYEGTRPVYATLVSTGKRKHETPKGTFRIWLKFAEADMTGGEGRERYRVATVPWTMFFHGNFALHTAYWHDRFGQPVSHGCVNLAPRDARALYQWAAPEVPSGWSMVYGATDAPGSRIRVRSGPGLAAGAPLSLALSEPQASP